MLAGNDLRKIEFFLRTYSDELSRLGLNASKESKNGRGRAGKLLFHYLSFKRLIYVLLFPQERFMLFKERLLLDHTSKKIHETLKKSCAFNSKKQTVKLNRFTLLKMIFKFSGFFYMKPHSADQAEVFSVFLAKFFIAITLLKNQKLKGVVSVDDLVPSRFACLCASHFLGSDAHLFRLGNYDALLDFPWVVNSLVCNSADQVEKGRRLRLAQDIYQVEDSNVDSISFNLSFREIKNIGVIANAFTTSDQITEYCKTLENRFKGVNIYIQPHPRIFKLYEDSILEYELVRDLGTCEIDIIIAGNTTAVFKFYNQGIPTVYTNDLENIYKLNFTDLQRVNAIDPKLILCSDYFTMVEIKEFYQNKSVDFHLHPNALGLKTLCAKLIV